MDKMHVERALPGLLAPGTVTMQKVDDHGFASRLASWTCLISCLRCL